MSPKISQAEQDARRTFGTELDAFVQQRQPGLKDGELAHLVGKHSVLASKAPGRNTVRRVLKGEDNPGYTFALEIVDAVVRLGQTKADPPVADEAAITAVAQWLGRWLELDLPAPGIPTHRSAEAVTAWLAGWRSRKHPPEWPAESAPGSVPTGGGTAPEPGAGPGTEAAAENADQPGPAESPAPVETGAAQESHAPADRETPEADTPLPTRSPRWLHSWWGRAAAAASVVALAVALMAWTLSGSGAPHGSSSDALTSPSPGASKSAARSANASPSPSPSTEPSPSTTVPGPSMTSSPGGVAGSSPGPVVTPTGQSTRQTPQPTQQRPTATPSSAPPTAAAPGWYPATVAWTDDGAPGGTDLIVYDSPNADHRQAHSFKEGDSLQVVCQVTSNDSIKVGPTYSNPKPPPSNLWYKITFEQDWAPAVYVNTHGASIPTC